MPQLIRRDDPVAIPVKHVKRNPEPALDITVKSRQQRNEFVVTDAACRIDIQMQVTKFVRARLMTERHQDLAYAFD